MPSADANAVRRPPYVSTVLAATSVLTLLGLFALALLEGRALLRTVRESVAVVVELRPTITFPERKALGQWLEGRAFAKAGSVRYIDRVQGAEILKRDFGEDFLAYDLDNPLHDIYTLNLREEQVTPRGIAAVQAEISAREEVIAAYVQEDFVRQLAARVDAVGWAGAGFGALLLCGVVFLVLNTTRLALLAQSTLIRNMELVGASRGFISRPFLRRALGMGLVSGLLAAGVSLGLAYLVYARWPQLWTELPWPSLVAVGLGLLVLSVALNFASTFYVVRRALQLRVDDLATLA